MGRPGSKEVRESSDQAVLVAKLKRAGWTVVHTPNQGNRKPNEIRALTAMGAVWGWPDLQVYGSPTKSCPCCDLRPPGVAAEMRRRGKKRQITAKREAIYKDLESKGWIVLREQTGAEATEAFVRMGYLPVTDLPGYSAVEDLRDA